MKESVISHCKIQSKNKYVRDTVFRHIFTCFQSMHLVVCLKNAFDWGSQHNNNAQQDRQTPSYQYLFICAVFNATCFDILGHPQAIHKPIVIMAHNNNMKIYDVIYGPILMLWYSSWTYAIGLCIAWGWHKKKVETWRIKNSTNKQMLMR
jgi:hypothetical protein